MTIGEPPDSRDAKSTPAAGSERETSGGEVPSPKKGPAWSLSGRSVLELLSMVRAGIIGQVRYFTHPLPVSTPQERRHRRNMRLAGGLALLIVIGMLLPVALWGTHIQIAFGVVLIMCINFYVLWTTTQLSGGHFNARRRLRESGYRVCPCCQYDLASLPESGVCPECGHEYSPDSLRDEWESTYSKLLQKPGR